MMNDDNEQEANWGRKREIRWEVLEVEVSLSGKIRDQEKRRDEFLSGKKGAILKPDEQIE